MYALIYDGYSGDYIEGSPYNRGKLQARDKAQVWQNEFPDHDYDYFELAAFHDMFTRLGRRYGLLTEFRENGII